MEYYYIYAQMIVNTTSGKVGGHYINVTEKFKIGLVTQEKPILWASRLNNPQKKYHNVIFNVSLYFFHAISEEEYLAVASNNIYSKHGIDIGFKLSCDRVLLNC